LTQVLQLGVVRYAEGLELQRQAVELRKQNAIPDTLILLEHTPVITLGRNAKNENVIVSREQLAARGVEIFECDRGGDVTYHGPGQLVGYPIFDLRGFRDGDGQRKTMWPVEFVRHVEEALIQTCAEFGTKAGLVPGLTGVWVNAEDAVTRRKIAAIGIHISRGVSSHGFALNVTTDLSAFDLIVPCGIANCAVTSLQRELGREVAISDVAKAAAQSFGRVFNAEVRWVEELGPANQDVPVRVPRELERLHGSAKVLG
jgi:lipoyl(octanoyl) transferase